MCTSVQVDYGYNRLDSLFKSLCGSSDVLSGTASCNGCVVRPLFIFLQKHFQYE